MKVVFFDLETTGTLVNKHGIHQISGMIVIDGEVKETFDFKVQPNPKAEIVQEALDVAGVTKEQILSYPAMGYVYGQFTAILNKYVDKYNKQDKFFLAGYNNASFDNQFLRAWFLQNGDKYFGSYFWSNSIRCNGFGNSLSGFSTLTDGKFQARNCSKGTRYRNRRKPAT